MPVFPFPELELFLQRKKAADSQIREGDWQSRFCQKNLVTVDTQENQTKNKMTSKSGKKKVPNVHQKDVILKRALSFETG